MTTQFEQMEACIHLGAQHDEASFRQLLAALDDADWQVRYTACVALGDRPDPAAIAPLLTVLAHEDAAPLYSQPQEFASLPAGGNAPPRCDFPEGTTVEIQDAWHRRGRVKQVACLALGAIGVADPDVLVVLQRYAVEQAEDYAVRAASCKALGLIGDAASLPALAQAMTDQEWCTRTEATKAHQRITSQL